jgi:hypothetical protein
MCPLFNFKKLIPHVLKRHNFRPPCSLCNSTKNVKYYDQNYLNGILELNGYVCRSCIQKLSSMKSLSNHNRKESHEKNNQ